MRAHNDRTCDGRMGDTYYVRGLTSSGGASEGSIKVSELFTDPIQNYELLAMRSQQW